MAKFISRAGLLVEAYVVTQAEGKLAVQLDGGGMEQLRAGDALINAPDGTATYIVRARLFDALFDEQQQPEQPQQAVDDELPDSQSQRGET